MQKVCIAVHDDLLAAALAVSRIKRPLGHEETLQARQERYQAGNTPYPAWYLFGSREKQAEGLVKCYHNQGLQVFLCPETLLTPIIDADMIDCQLCTVTDSLYEKLLRHRKRVRGYLPESLSSKSHLAQLLANFGGARFLPVQKTYHRTSSPVLPETDSTVWITKLSRGAAGRNSDGTPYMVWHKNLLAEKLPELLTLLNSDIELICSEFVLTNDPYADFADHVVHKMHFYCDGKTAAKPYGSVCQRFIHRCNWAALEQRETMPLADFIGHPHITTGRVDSIKEFPNLSDALGFHVGLVIFSADFILPPHGVPQYLESNKLAATFAEQFDPHLPPIIDFYTTLHQSDPVLFSNPCG